MHKVKRYKSYSIIKKLSNKDPLHKHSYDYKSFREAKQVVKNLSRNHPQSYFEIWKIEQYITVYKLPKK